MPEAKRPVHTKRKAAVTPSAAGDARAGRARLPVRQTVHQSTERRAHRRYPLKKGAFAMLQSSASRLEDITGMSQGEIGMAVIKSKPVRMGEIKDVSRSGLAFQYPAGRSRTSVAHKIDIVLAENALCLKGLNFKSIAETEVDEGRPYAPIKTKQQQIQFIDLTKGQQAMLDHLIQTHADISPSSR